MNLTLPVLLAIAGIAMIVIGVIGQLRFKDWFDIGTTSAIARGTMFILGLGLIGLSYVVYRPEINTDPTDQLNSAVTTVSAAEAPDQEETANVDTEPQLSIDSPEPNEKVAAETDNGAARITVSGKLSNPSASDARKIFVFTHTPGSDEWWFDEPAEVDSHGNWSTTVLYGSEDEPVKKGSGPIIIQAVWATQKAVDDAQKDQKMVRKLDDIKGSILSDQVSVTIGSLKN